MHNSWSGAGGNNMNNDSMNYGRNGQDGYCGPYENYTSNSDNGMNMYPNDNNPNIGNMNNSFEFQGRNRMPQMENGNRRPVAVPSMDPPGSGTATGRLLRLMENPAAAALLERALAEDLGTMPSSVAAPAPAPYPLLDTPEPLVNSSRLGDHSNFNTIQRKESRPRERSSFKKPYSSQNAFSEDFESKGGKVICVAFTNKSNSQMDGSLLNEIFADFGPLTKVQVLEHKRMAFIGFQHVSAAADACSAMNNQTVDGARLRVTMARERNNSQDNSSPGGGRNTERLGGYDRGAEQRGRGGEQRGRGGVQRGRDREQKGRGLLTPPRRGGVQRGRDGEQRGKDGGGKTEGAWGNLSLEMNERGYGETESVQSYGSKQRPKNNRRSEYVDAKYGTGRPKGKEIHSGPTLFIGFLSKMGSSVLDPKEVQAAFEPYGEVMNVKVAKRATFGFVSYATVEEGTAALNALNGEPIIPGGSPMTVEWVKAFNPKESYSKPNQEIIQQQQYSSNRAVSIKDRLRHDQGKDYGKDYAKDYEYGKVAISAKQEEKDIALDCPKEALYCFVCDSAAYAHTKHFINHLRSIQHTVSRELVIKANISLIPHLEKASKLAENQKKTRLNLKNKEHTRIDGEEEASTPTPERMAFLEVRGKQKCKFCAGKIFSPYADYLDHICSVKHLKNRYESEKDESTDPDKIDEQETKSKFVRVEAEIESAKETAELCPVSLEEPPTYDPEESFAMELIHKTCIFRCNACKKELSPAYVKSHCRSVSHYENAMRSFKRKKAFLEAKVRYDLKILKRKRLNSENNEGKENLKTEGESTRSTKFDRGFDDEDVDFEIRSETSATDERMVEELTDVILGELDEANAEEEFQEIGDAYVQDNDDDMEDEHIEKRMKMDAEEEERYEDVLLEGDDDEQL